MGKLFAHVLFCVALAAPVWAQAPQSSAAGTSATALDLILVLDNSGSMRRNDSQFLTRAVVLQFVNSERLPQDTRVSVVLFGDTADLLMPLSSLKDAATRQRLQASLQRLDYSGRLTDTAAAIERALYEMNHDGRAGAQKAIVLMTDGIIDTGDRARDLERNRWVTTELADASARAGTRIFGVAFTDRADFQLIQSLGEKTGGDYYRILTAEEVPGAFARIAEGLTRRSVPATTSATTSATSAAGARPGATAPAAVAVVSPGGQRWWLILGPALGLLGLVVAVLALAPFWRGQQPQPEKKESSSEPIVERRRDDLIPEGERAYLQDLNDPPVLAEPKYELTRKVTKIGRMQGRNGVLRVDKATVSAQHAEIRYQQGNYYLVDTESVNKTRIDDGTALQPYVEAPLKSGRIISIANCRFEFIVQGTDTDATQAWILDPSTELGVRPVAKKGQGGNYFASK